MLGDREDTVRERQAEQDERENVETVNGVHWLKTPARLAVTSTFPGCCLHSKRGYATLGVMQKAEPLVERRVWLPQSLDDWVKKEAKRRELRPSPFIRTHLAAVKERQEAARS